MPYQPPPIETDLDVVTARIFDGIAVQIPGWEPTEGTLDTAIAEEVGRETAETNNRMVEVLGLSIVAVGETVFELPARIGTAADLEVAITTVNVGDVIPQGFLVIGTTQVGVDVAFELLEAVTTTTNPQTVTMYATQVGTIGNGVPAGPVVIATSTATVVAAEVTTPSANGTEPETMQAYLDRLKDYLSVFRVGAVRAADVEVLARTVNGVWRARAIDLYDALSESTTAERTATVYVIDADGEPVSSAVKTVVYALIESVRELNFVLYVEDATYTGLDIVFTAIAEPGRDAEEVENAVIAAITAHLSPATWGSNAAEPKAWAPSNTVRYLDVVSAAGNTPGVSFLATLTINGETSDVILPGKVGLPSATTALVDPTTITGSVT